MRSQRLSLALLLATLGAVAFGGCGSAGETTSSGKTSTSDTTGPASTTAPVERKSVSPPSGPIAPSETLATIASAPRGAGVISGAEFDQGLTQAAAIRSLKQIPKPGSEEYLSMKNEVLAGLIIYVWLEGEAEEMGVEPTDAEVAAALRKNSETDFLREHEYTQATMMERTKNNLLVEKIEDVLAKQSPKNPQKAYTEFDNQFEAQWHARTHCVKGFIVQQCGNYQSG